MHQTLKKFFGRLEAALAAIFLIPTVSFAAEISRSSSNFSDFKSFIGFIVGSILGPLAKVLAGLVIIYFLYGVSQYILHADESEKREEGRKMMFAGIIAIAIMVSLWALVGIVVNTVLNTNVSSPSPTIPAGSELIQIEEPLF